MSDYKLEEWVNLYQAAVSELKHSLITGRILDARAEIVNRIKVLRELPGIHRAERQAIEDALHAMKFLGREQLRYEEEQQRVIARGALKKLDSIAPTIERLTSGEPTVE